MTIGGGEERRRREELSDGRVRLLRYRPEHALAVFAAIMESRCELTRWMAWCGPNYSYEDCLLYANSRGEAWQRGEAYIFVIQWRDGDEVLGLCGLNRIDRVDLRANLGYWVRTSRVGRGVATAATLLLARFGFEDLGLMRLEICVAVDNLASQRVAEKAGAWREGRLRNRLRLQGVQHDAFLFALTP
jgi:RimJ/RimL family protein N-acetyltransferase